MIDYFFKFTDEASARLDVAMSGYEDATRALWNKGCVLLDVKAWRPSQDSTSVDAFGNTLVTHTFLNGWFCIVATPSPVSALLNHAALQFALDRDGPPWIVRNNIGGIITDVWCGPLFAGSRYPQGGWS